MSLKLFAECEPWRAWPPRAIRRASAPILYGWIGLVACVPSEPVSRPSEGSLAIGVDAAARTVLPPLATAALDFDLGGLLFLGLNFGTWGDDGLDYLPGHPMGLARSWTVEGSRLTYHLDTRHHWSDGVPVRAADVRFTFELLRDTTLALPLSSVTGRMDSISTPDDSTVVFHFQAEYPGMLFDTGVGVIPEHFFGALPRSRFRGGVPLPDGRTHAELPVSGPFALVEWSPEERIVLVRNDLAVDPARLGRVVVRVLPDETTRAAELRAGNLQAARINSFRTAVGLEGAGLDLLAIPQRGYDYIAWHPGGHPAFASPDVRKALSLAIDREEVLAALDMTGFAEPAWGPYGSLFDGLRAPPPHAPLHDPVEARSLLAATGWRDADGDGVRERGEDRLAFDLWVPAGNDRREDAAEIIQAQLADVGVEARIRPSEFNALFGRLMAGEYEAALMGWQVALDPDISPFWADPLSPLNVVELSIPSVTRSIESALARADAAAAAPEWRAAGAEVAAAYPYAFLWYFDIPFVIDPSVRDVRIGPSGWATGLADWWVADDAGAGTASGAGTP